MSILDPNLIEYLDRRFDRVEAHLVALNGRVRTTEQEVAILKDRATTDPLARGAGLLGAILGGAAAVFTYVKGH